ncbi:MAG: hypothetical protein WC471_01700 [Candidatus Woesearchaeota archaeon]
MKKTVMGLALAAVLSLGYGDSSSAKDKTIDKPVPIECVRGNDKVYFKSQEEGEKDLAAQVLSSKVEDSWFYWNGVWADVGTNELPKEVSVNPDLEDLMNNKFKGIKAGDVIYDYHIHPFSGFTKEGKKKIPLMSLADLLLHSTMRKKLEPYGVILKSRIVDEFGVTEYSLHDELYSRMHTGDKTGIKDILSENILLKVLSGFSTGIDLRDAYYYGLIMKGVKIDIRSFKGQKFY